MGKFSSDLNRILRKRLPQSNEYYPSRWIEGAMVRSEEEVPHDFVAIIIDSEIDAEEYKSLSDKLFRFLKKDEYFKYPQYRIYLWKDNKLSFVNQMRTRACRLNNYFEKVSLNEDVSGTWENFWEMYKAFRRTGQVIMITSKAKVEALRESEHTGGRNLLIVYQGDEDTKPIETVSRISCVACLPDKKRE